MEDISSESLQNPVGDQLGGAAKSGKDDCRFLAGEVPLDQLPMSARVAMMEGQTNGPFGSF